MRKDGVPETLYDKGDRLYKKLGKSWLLPGE